MAKINDWETRKLFRTSYTAWQPMNRLCSENAIAATFSDTDISKICKQSPFCMLSKQPKKNPTRL